MLSRNSKATTIRVSFFMRYGYSDHDGLIEYLTRSCHFRSITFYTQPGYNGNEDVTAVRHIQCPNCNHFMEFEYRMSNAVSTADMTPYVILYCLTCPRIVSQEIERLRRSIVDIDCAHGVYLFISGKENGMDYGVLYALLGIVSKERNKQRYSILSYKQDN